MQRFTIKKYFIAQANQQIFNMEMTFIGGTTIVTLNGSLQSSSYTIEPEKGTITFLIPILFGDIVSISITKEVSESNVQIVSYGNKDMPNALFKRYSSELKLKFNNRYKICLKINDQEIKWQFVTKMNPLFSTVKKVMEDIGEFIQGFTEEYLLSIIHRNSWDIIKTINEENENGGNLSTEFLQDATTGEYSTKARAVYNWVRAKSEIDLIYARYYGISYQYGSITKTIGDITIEKSTNLPLIEKLLEKLKKEAKQAEETIFGGGVYIGGYVKGSINYSYGERGTF